MLACITQVAAQTSADAERFVKLGLSPECAVVTGNIKFDVHLNESMIEAGRALRKTWGQRAVWIAASTHAGEEEHVLKAFAEVKKTLPKALLVLVPRHPPRFNEVITLSSKNFKVLSRTEQKESQKNCDENIDVFVGNTLGELPFFYASADVAFVGGSLVPIGGHNLLEPASLGLPIVIGKHVFSCVEMSDLLVKASAAIKIEDPAKLAEVVIGLLNDPARCRQMGERGQALVREGQGALERYMGLVDKLLVHQQ